MDFTNSCRPRHIAACVFMLACLLSGTVQANPELPVKFHRMMLDSGLSQSSIISIHQDRHGFIWMGTQDGLNRFDGRRIVTYKTDIDDPRSVSDPNIWCIAEDSGGYLWIGTEGGGFNRYDPYADTFTPYRYDPARRASADHYNVRAVAVDADGGVWLGTLGDGLVYFDPRSESVNEYRHDPNDPTSLPSNDIYSLLIDANGLIWIGSTGGLTRFSPVVSSMRNFRNDPSDPTTLLAGEVYGLSLGASGRLWVGTTTGLCSYDPVTDAFTYHALEPNQGTKAHPSPVNAVFEAPDGIVWVGTEHRGLYRLDPRTGLVRNFQNDPQDDYSLSDNDVTAITMDRGGVVWVGTSNGANRLDSKAKQFYHVCHQPGNEASLSHNCVWAIWEDQRGEVWVITESGLNIYNPRTGEVRPIESKPDDPHYPSYNSFVEIYEDQRGQIWFGARDGALDRYDPTTGLYQRYAADPTTPELPDDNRIFTMTGDQQGSVWFGTMDGLQRYDPRSETFTSYHHDPDNPDSLPEGSVRDIICDHEGRLWLSIWGNGVAAFQPRTGEINHYEHRPDDRTSLSSNVVLCVFQDSQHRIWLGTTTGLNKLDPATGRAVWITEREGLPNNTIYGIQEDESGYLWFSTNYGLVRYGPRHGTVNTYLTDDGIQDNEFNMGAAHRGHSGKMYFGGIKGFNAFYPDSIRNNGYVPEVVLTDFRIFNKPVPVGQTDEKRVVLEQAISEADHINLTHRDHVISFEFAALHYASPEKNRFAYMLEGFESEWNEVGSRNHATYTNLPPGDYTFRVRGSNNDGVWNDRGAAVTLSVRPPVYRTIWFISLAVSLLAAIIYGAHCYRMRLLDIKNRLLERRVQERTEDLTQANAQLQQEIGARTRVEGELREAKNHAEAATQAKSEFLANMSHEIRTPMNGVLGMTSIMLGTEMSKDQREYCEMIHSSAKNLLVVINDILDFSKIEAGKLEIEHIEFDLCHVMDGVAETLAMKAYEKNLNFDYNIGTDVPRFLVGDPARLRQILLNLTNNAVKFTHEGGVDIRISTTGVGDNAPELLFEVTDTGVGIPPDRLDKIFGSFTQVDASVTRQYGGTGLGLAIVKQLVELMGGQVGLDSAEGNGTTFWFSLALPRAEVSTAEHTDGRILVVHEQAETRTQISDQLCYLGFEAEIATDTDACVLVQAAEQADDPFSVVLVGSGRGKQRIRELGFRLQAAAVDSTPRLVGICDRCCMFDQTELEADGLSAYLTLPLHFGRLDSVVRALLDETGTTVLAWPQDQVDNLIPVAPSHADASSAADSSGDAAGGTSAFAANPDGEKLLLLAEDNPINQRVACLMLEKAGYTVDVAASGLQVLEAVAQKDYLAILMDVQMPEMDGLEATRRIRAADSPARNPHIPIVALTAHAMDQDRQRSLDAGMNDHISKPIESEEITRILARVLEAGVTA